MRVAAFQKRPVPDDARAVCAAVAQDVSWAAGEEVRELAEALRRFPVTAVVGVFQRRGNTVRNVALVLRAGAVVGVYAKARPNESGVEAGHDMPVFEADGTRSR